MLPLQSIKVLSLVDFRVWVAGHLDLFKPGNLILLKGGMGAGKTTFVSLVVEALGGNAADVSSPTFALHQSYPLRNFAVDHMDLYRLESDHDLNTSGFFEVLEDHKNLRFIEWSERIPDELFYGQGDEVIEIEIINLGDEMRELSFRRL